MNDAPEATETATAPDPTRVRRAIVRGAAIGLAVGALTGLLSFGLERLHPAAPLPDHGPLPVFELTDQAGQSFGSAQLAGTPWIAGFVFTRCTDSCPLITSRMASLQRRLRATPVRLVTFTVDPARDGPAVLADYGRKAGADFTRWSFLTGPGDRIQALVTRGFKLTMLGGDPDAGEGDVVHDDRLVLVDGRGHVRGYYGSDLEAVARLAADARRLAKGS